MKSGSYFAAKLQTVLIVLLVVGMVLIAQQWNKDIYKIGMVVLIGAALVQVPFGNALPEWNFRQSMKFLVIGMAILVSIFAISIVIVPYLLKLGRG